MPISHTKKAIFVHIPKCAGSSINKLILPEVNSLMGRPDKFSLRFLYGRNLQHLTARKIKLMKPFSFGRYYKFAFIRNPWSRMLSEYKWRCSWDEETSSKTFEQFICSLPEYRAKGDPHFLPSYDFVFNKKGKQMVDFIGRHESIEQDMQTVMRALNISDGLTRTNVSVSPSQDAHELNYNQQMSEIIEDLFAEDILKFGYEKPSTV